MSTTLRGQDNFDTDGPGVGGTTIVESGSNSDGEWTRYYEGTQVCASVGDTFSNNATTNLTCPIAFANSDFAVISYLITGPTSGVHGLFGQATAVGTYNVYLNSGGSDRTGQTVMIGRWA